MQVVLPNIFEHVDKADKETLKEIKEVVFPNQDVDDSVILGTDTYFYKNDRLLVVADIEFGYISIKNFRTELVEHFTLPGVLLEQKDYYLAEKVMVDYIHLLYQVLKEC